MTHLPLIPQPARIEQHEGTLKISAQTRIVASSGDAAACAAADQLARLLEEQPGLRLARAAQAQPFDIVLATDSGSGFSPEAYTLEINTNGAHIRAADSAGLFYGAVTLWQLLSAETQSPASLPALRIEDAPRFAWRGFMIDSARHIQMPEEIKKLIDQAARHKLNTLHWHLVDDQGWRLEIQAYPKLTGVGAWRTPAGKAGIGPDGQPLRYGGFFTQDQAREIVAYARERHITVVPEIEMPGHAQAAIASYPEFGASGTQPPVSSDWGIHEWLFNVEDSTFAFLENVFREVMAIFPSRYIHIGGDEAAKQQWRNSPQIQKRIAELGLESEAALQSYFVRRIGKFLAENGRKLLGWDEILDGGPLPEGAAVMVWREMRSAGETVRSGHDVIATPHIPYYLNYVQSTASDEPTSHGNLTPLQKVYDFEPVPADFDEAQARHILGIQGNVWTEHIRRDAGLEHMFFPRLSAIAETAWTPKAARDWQSFLHRLAPQMRRFERSRIHAADSAFAVRIEAQATGDTQAIVSLANQTSFGEIRYTLDGSVPNSSSPLYAQVFHVSFPANVSANAFLDGQALAKPRSERIDALALRTRRAERLIPAGSAEDYSYTRLEADEPVEKERLTLSVPVSKPIWKWEGAALDSICTLRAEVLDLPHNFQHAYHENYRPEKDALAGLPAEPVFIQVYLDSTEGTPIAQAEIPAQETTLKTLDVPLPTLSGTHDLFVTFSLDPRRTLWAVYRLRLLTGKDL